LLSGLDNKLAILKGLIGASPHTDSVVTKIGGDVFLVLDGLNETMHHLKLLLSQSLKEMQVMFDTPEDYEKLRRFFGWIPAATIKDTFKSTTC